MEPINGKIRIYEKKQERKLKDGSIKEYKTRTVTVSLEKTNQFEDNEKVVVYSAKDVDKMFSKLKETNEDLTNQLDRLRNKHDHLQERLRTSLEEINTQQKVIINLSNRSFLDYLLGRKSDLKELE